METIFVPNKKQKNGIGFLEIKTSPEIGRNDFNNNKQEDTSNILKPKLLE